MAYCVPRGIPHSVFLDWDPLDQDKALAWMRAQARNCGGCGTNPDDWKNDRFAHVGQQRSCPGCEVLAQERENVPEQAKGYTYVYLVPRELARTPEEEGIAT